MFWRITLTILLVGFLCVATETRKPRPRGSIPSPSKTKVNLSERQRLLSWKPDVLSSSREALVVTESRYLRRDWCKTQPLRQTVSEEGCRSRTVVNRFCYGQCNSFYIPRHMSSSSNRGPGSGRKKNNKAEEPFLSCSFCRPQRVTQLTVQLDCPGLQPNFRHRKVQHVKQCRCMSVDVNDNRKL